MEETVPAGRDHAPASERRTDLCLLAVLLLLTLALRGWLLWHTEVAARDSIGYIRYALTFENPDYTWSEVVKKFDQHPGYPLWLLAVSVPVRAMMGGISAESMQLSAQIASGLAGLLLVIPMYWLGKTLVSRSAGFWGALLFQFLPICGHNLSDGISEALYLFLAAVALLHGVHAVRGRGGWSPLWCGLFGGLAYWTRPEGLLIPLAAIVAVVGMQWSVAWRRSGQRFRVCAAGLLLPVIVMVGLYVAVTGRISDKPSVQRFFQFLTRQASSVGPVKAEDNDHGANAFRAPLQASLWGVFIKPHGNGPMRLMQGMWAVAWEFTQAVHYIWALPVLLGMWWQRRRFAADPALWFLALVSCIYIAVLCRLVLTEGYVSDRHVMVLVLLATYPAVFALEKVTAHLGRKAPIYSLAVMLLMIGVGLPKTLQPLHRNRGGHHAAGLWLAEQLRPGDIVDDDHCWAHYFAGQVFEEGKPAPKTADARRYVVITRSRDSHVGLTRKQSEQEIRARGGTVVYHWPMRQPEEEARVVVYSLPLH
jgi:hypothetical protein